MWADLQQLIDRLWQQLPQAPGLLLADHPRRPCRLHIPGEDLQGFAKDPVRRANRCINRAGAVGYNQIGVIGLSTAGEFPEQGGFTPARLAGDKDNPAMPANRFLQGPLQKFQLPLPADERLFLLRAPTVFGR